MNLHTDENGLIAAHPGQTGSEDPKYDFEAGATFLEVVITKN